MAMRNQLPSGWSEIEFVVALEACCEKRHDCCLNI